MVSAKFICKVLRDDEHSQKSHIHVGLTRRIESTHVIYIEHETDQEKFEFPLQDHILRKSGEKWIIERCAGYTTHNIFCDVKAGYNSVMELVRPQQQNNVLWYRESKVLGAPVLPASSAAGFLISVPSETIIEIKFSSAGKRGKALIHSDGTCEVDLHTL